MLALPEFFAVIKAFRKGTGRTETGVSSWLFNDGKRLRTVRRGGDIGVRKVTTALNQLSRAWPRGIEWPRGIRRPQPKKRSLQ